MHEITFLNLSPEPQRQHYLHPSEFRILLDRMPTSLYCQLREVRFDDMNLGLRRLGYVSADRHTIAICALPRVVDLTRYLEGRSSRLFGALPGTPWPKVAVKRFLLYDIFLQLLGHTQMVSPDAAGYLKYAGPGEARKFAHDWRTRLWKMSEGLSPLHCPPNSLELATLGEELPRERELISL